MKTTGLLERVARRSWALVAMTVPLLVGCASDPITPPTCETDASLCPTEPDTIGQYLAGLPTWQEFAQPDTTFRNELNVAGDTLPIEEEIVDSIPIFDEDAGISGWDTNVRFVCQSKPYTMQDTPEDLVMYDPDREILYAGALIQGKSHKDPVGSLLGLPIAQRTQIRVSIPDLPTGESFRLVNPTQAEVEAARGEMIGNAVRDGLATPSSSHFSMESYHSEKSFALGTAISGKYLSFEGSASGSTSRSVGETTITVHYTEAMYTVAVEPPQTPDAFFTEEFTNERLAEQVRDGKMGPDNLPVYVSSIVYGRAMMFSFTSTASESDIRTTLQASYDNLVNSANITLSAKQEAILEQAKISIASIGGSSKATAAMIRSGDWTQYFATTDSLSHAAPLSYTFRNLVGDGRIASVTEATEYTITECTPKPLVPGVFDFNTVVTLNVSLDPGYETFVGDFNSDGLDDLLFNFTSGVTNEVAVALGDGLGGFAVQAVQADTAQPAEGWSLFDETLIGDFDADGDDDILWNKKDTENVLYVGLSNGDGTFEWGGRQTHPLGGWGSYQTLIANVDNANGDDIVWNITTDHNRTYVGLSNGDGTFDLTAVGQDAVGTCCWQGTRTFVGDVDGDGFKDMIWNRITNDNVIWVARGNNDGTFGVNPNIFTPYGTNGWGDYKSLVGNFDGDNSDRTDLILIADGRADIPVHRARALSNGTFEVLGWQHVPDSADGTGPFEVRMGDVDADGDDDIIFVDLDSSNNRPATSNNVKIWVGLGTVDQDEALFDFRPVDQIHPVMTTWNQYRVFLAYVNADNKADLILSWNTDPHNIYVALAK